MSTQNANPQDSLQRMVRSRSNHDPAPLAEKAGSGRSGRSPSFEAEGVTLHLGTCEDVLPLIDGIHAIISDPPYGLNYSARQKKWPGQKAKQKDGNKWGKEWSAIEGDDAPFDPAALLGAEVVILWGAPNFCDALPRGKTWLVWDKQSSEDWSAADCELAFTNFGNGGVRKWSCLWQGFLRDREIREHYHPTQKPVDLMAWCMDVAKVPKGALVCDPYAGSGSTAIACIRTGRRFVGVEKDPEHFATAVARIQRELSQPDFFLGGGGAELAGDANRGTNEGKAPNDQAMPQEERRR